eukprot:2093776-Pleurochrysis_carterae.AAC.3
MDGDVWLAPEEVVSIANHKELDVASFIDEYGRKKLKGWVCLKQSPGRENGCVFLDADTRQCGIYDVRPVQCSTYPFWPSLVDDPDAWEEEAVLPDDATITNFETQRYWDAEFGGCEGINQPDATIVPADEIQAKRNAARKHWRRFPGFFIKRRSWRL